MASIAQFVSEITTIDPDTKGEVKLSIFKHECGGMFAIDSSFLEQRFEDDKEPIINDVFSERKLNVILKGV